MNWGILRELWHKAVDWVRSKRHAKPRSLDMPLTIAAAAASRPLRPLIDQWVADRRGMGYSDWKRDHTAVTEMVDSLGWADVQHFNAAEFRAYLGEMSTPGSRRLVGREVWHPRTRNKMHSHMSSFVRYLIDTGAMPGPNWVLQIPRAPVRNPGDGKEAFTPEQFWALHAKTIERGKPEHAAMFLALWRTAMPPSDWSELEVRHLTDPPNGGVPVILVRRQKTTRRRPIPLAPDVVEWFREQAKGKVPTDKLLPPLPSLPTLKRHVVAAGMDETMYGFTSFRKGFACDRALAGAPLDVVQKVMSHGSSRTTTEFYQKFSGAQLAQGLGFTPRPENSGGKTLDLSGNSSEDTPVTSMSTTPETIRDDSARASASGLDVTILAPGVEARADSPRVSEAGKATCGIRTHDLCFTNARAGESAGATDNACDDQTPTSSILILAERATGVVVDAGRTGRSDSFVAAAVSVAMAAMDALRLRLARHNATPTTTA